MLEVIGGVLVEEDEERIYRSKLRSEKNRVVGTAVLTGISKRMKMEWMTTRSANTLRSKTPKEVRCGLEYG
jgi:hypothetical protein